MPAVSGGQGFPEPQVVIGSAQDVAMVRAVVEVDKIPAFYDRAYPLIFGLLGARGIAPAGAPMGISFCAPTATIELGAAVPVAGPVSDDGEVVAFALPGGPAAKVRFRGSYEQLPAVYSHIRSWLVNNGYTPGTVSWEQYVTEPGGDPEQNITDVFWAIG